MKKRPSSRIQVSFLVFLILILVLLGGRMAHTTTYGSLGTTDFIEYWSAGALLMDGNDPYDPVLLLEIQQQLGRSHARPLLMWNPPWLLIVLLPVVWFDFGLSSVLWLALNLAIILFSSTFIWRFLGGKPGPGLFLAWVTGVSFFPFLLCWGVGQTSCLVLLGVVLFLASERTGNPWTGAVGLLFLSCKPQTVYLLGLIIAVQTIRHRNWRLATFAALLLAVSGSLLTLLRPEWLFDYARALERPPLYWATPTLGGVVRQYFSLPSSTVQYVPALATALGALWMISRRPVVRWESSISVILLASSLTAPFGWSYDQVILLFPCLESLLRVGSSSSLSRGRRVVIVLLVYGYSGLLFAFNSTGINEVHRFWLNLLPLTAFCLSGSWRSVPPPPGGCGSQKEITS